VRFVAHDDCAIGLAFAQRKIVYAHDAHRTAGWHRRGSDQAQEAPCADPQTLRARLPHARFAAQSKAHLLQARPQAARALRPGLHEQGQTFGEDPPPTPTHPTDEAAGVQVQDHPRRAAGQIGQRACIVGMHPL